MWAQLQTMGYSYVGIWDNFGNPIEILSIEYVPARAELLDASVAERGYHYWDVAAVHAEDHAGKAALDRLFVRAL
jgi:hypothetical protein